MGKDRQGADGGEKGGNWVIEPPEKPPYGDRCNGCGKCCEREICPLGAQVFRRVDGPCPALLRDERGVSACGLVVSPERFAPLRAYKIGIGELSRGAAVIIGAGHGCDALFEGETRRPGTQAKLLAKCDAIRPARAARAKVAWGFA